MQCQLLKSKLQWDREESDHANKAVNLSILVKWENPDQQILEKIWREKLTHNR